MARAGASTELLVLLIPAVCTAMASAAVVEHTFYVILDPVSCNGVGVVCRRSHSLLCFLWLLCNGGRLARA